MAKQIFNISFTQPCINTRMNGHQIQKWKEERSFYDWTAKYNYASYTLNHEKTQTHKDSLDYFTKSTGAFDLNHVYKKEELKTLKKDLKKTKSIIWHGFISFDTELSKKMNTEEDCIKYLNRNMGVLIENSHLDKNNLNFVCSLHKDTNNRHIHFQFWEKEAKRENKSFTKKGMIKQVAIDNFMVSSNLYFDEEKYDISSIRDEAMRKLKELCPSVKYKRTYTDSIDNQIVNLSEKLPREGRLSYKSKNMDALRNDVDKVVNFIINSQEEIRDKVIAYHSEINKRIEKIKNIMKEQNFAYINNQRLSKEDIKKLTENNAKDADKKLFAKIGDLENIKQVKILKEDLKVRMGNYVIYLAKISRKDTLERRKTSVNNKSAKIEARKRRLELKKNIDRFLFYLKKDDFITKTCFTNNLHLVEKEIQKENFERGAYVK